ncbi:LPS export ABC transporter periplasmic protein LptC [Bdellovibrio sp. qaytius]|nr:LPS export ABC transporter periplasmic protein LptC [Bdellovibrio sp. qaytius]
MIKLLRKLKLNKISIFIAVVVGLIFVQALLMAPQDISPSETSASKQKAANEKSKEEIEKLAANGKRRAVEQKMVGVHLVENSNNAKGWELYADEATGSSDELWVLKKVKVEFYNENESSFVVSGDVGEINGQTKNMVIRGQVVTQSTNGYQFETSDLNYIAESKMLTSDSAVRMLGPEDKNGPGFNLNGQGFKIDLAKNKMYIESNIEANKAMDNKTFRVSSSAAEFSNKNQEALFSGNVNMKFDKTTITAPQAFFKYSEKQKALESILLKDQVVLKDEGKSAVCQVLLMNLIEDTMTLSGHPKVQMGEDEIQGEEIVFLEGGKKVKMNKVKIDSKKVQ